MKAMPSVSKMHPVSRYGYTGLLFLLTLTGFAQMPIFKRYYIADILKRRRRSSRYSTIRYEARARNATAPR